MSTRASPAVYLGLLTMIAAYAVFQDGGVPLFDWNLCMLALGLLAAAYAFDSIADPGPPMDRTLRRAVLLFVPYVACQLLPLPMFLLRVLSPTRAHLAGALANVMQPVTFAPLSIASSLTVANLLRVAAYTLVFLLARGLAGRLSTRPWTPVVPILILAALEAVLGIVQSAAGADFAHGTYMNKKHYAGLLEMALPLAVMWGIGRLFGRGSGSFSSALPAIQFSALLSVAVLIFIAILYSLSRMGFSAALFSLFVMAGVALGTRLPRLHTYVAVAVLAVLFVVSFVLLPPEALIAEFAKIVPTENFGGDGRFTIWRDTVHLIRAYPLFGCGFGTFDVAFLKYQTGVVDLDFAFAHNDFLQLVAELGVVGFLIPTAIILMVLLRALRAAESRGNAQVRYLGIACIGTFSALLLHSLVDFNLYIPANALVLTWIAGIASALPLPSRSPGADSGTSRMPLRKLAIALAALLIVYPAAWIVFLSRFHTDRRAERLFCRVGICDTDAVLAAGQSQNSAAPPPSAADAREFLRRDPANPHRWADLAESLMAAGQVDSATYCFARALDLGPNIPPVLWRAAVFYAGQGETRKALQNSSRLLRKSTLDDRAVFDWYTDRAFPFEEILQYGIPPDPRPTRFYVRYLIASGNVAGSVRAWNLALARGFADDELARDFLNFQMQQKAYEQAAGSWAAYLGPRRNGYRESNWLYDGDFEAAPSGTPFDWQIDRQPEVDVARDEHVAHSGSRSLRIRFRGGWNLSYANIRQIAVVPPGWYRFEAYVRTEDLTTDQGIGFRIFDAENPKRLDVRTEQLTGTHEWTRIELKFLAPQEARLLQVQVVRPQSGRIDNQIRGTVWIDSVKLAAEGN